MSDIHLVATGPIESPNSWLVAISVFVVIVLAGWGAAVLRLWPQSRLSGTPVVLGCQALCLGVLSFSVAGFVGALAGFRLVDVFAFGSLVALAACAATLRSGRKPRAEAALPAALATRQDAWLLAGAVALATVGSIVWSIGNLKGLEVQASAVILHPWQDTFFHARQIGDFARYTGQPGTLNPSMSAAPLPVYHYASYMVPALIASLGEIPALQVATGVYPLLGTVLTGAAMIVLAHGSAGAAGALVAIVLLYLVPNPAQFLPHTDHLDSYHFMQQVGVGGLYGVACMGLALAYANRIVRSHAVLPAAMALLLLLSAALFKVQPVLAYGLPFVLFVCLKLRARQPFAAAFAAAVATLSFLIVCVLLLPSLPNVPTLELGLKPMGRAIRELAAPFTVAPLALPVKLLLAPVAVLVTAFFSYGLMGVLTAVAVVWTWRSPDRRKSGDVLWLLASMLASHAVVRLLLADNTGFGDAYEINRKTVVWPYFVVVFCTAVLLTRSGLPRWIRSRNLRLGVSVGTVVSAAATLAVAPTLHRWSDIAPWQLRIPPGMLASAQFLRQQAGPLEVVQPCGKDGLFAMASLIERPVYMTRFEITAAEPSPGQRVRGEEIERIKRQVDAVSAFAELRKAGIDWFVAGSGCSVAWAGGASPVFEAGGFRVYRIAPAPAPGRDGARSP